MSIGIGYLTVDHHQEGDFVDVPWLDLQPAATETTHVRHIAFAKPLRIALNGRTTFGVVMKP
jgi:hypothetical protein